MAQVRDEDRRQFERLTVISPCKIRDRRGLLFSPGKTSNVSVGGALIRVDRVRSFREGDEVDFVIASDTCEVLRSAGMRRATIRRVTPIDHHHQALALEFAEAHAPMAHAA